MIRRATWLRRLLGALLCGHALLATGMAVGQVVVIADASSAAHAETVDSLAAALAPERVLRIDMTEAEARGLPAATLIVTVGSGAARATAASQTTVPTLHILLPRSALEALEHPPRGAPWSALLLDQPAARQVALIRLALPDHPRIAIVTGPDSTAHAAALDAAAARAGFETRHATADALADLYPALRTALEQPAVLVIPPDSQLFTGQTVHQVLLTAFRLRAPVLGYSAAYVRAGAVLGLYTTPAQVGTEAATVVRRVLAGAPLPAPAPHRLFEVGINQTVARALGLALPEAGWLAQTLQAQERTTR